MANIYAINQHKTDYIQIQPSKRVHMCSRCCAPAFITRISIAVVFYAKIKE